MEQNKAINKDLITTKSCLIGTIIFGLISICVAFSFASYFIIQNNFDKNVGGSVGLRQYYQTGTGTTDDPYVIASPNHFYNLTRLQNLGVYTNPANAHFKLGYDFTDDGVVNEQFYNPNYDPTQEVSVTNPMYIDYLDLTQYSIDKTMISIGNEATPFLGTFNGNHKVIEGLKIHSSPEDIGVFGYITSGATVKNTVFSNLEIYSDGYNTVTLGNLYLSSLASGAYIDLISDGTNLNINSNADLNKGISISNAQLTNLVFSRGQTGSVPSGISLALRASNTLVGFNEDSSQATISATALATEQFATVDNATINSRIYVIANEYVEAEAMNYSRVLCSYKFTLTNHLISNVSTPTATITKDYIGDTTDPDYDLYTNYAHGCNVGLIVGHVDGTLTDCYVYNGKINVNSGSSTTQTFLNHESENGLIGEIGINIKNDFNPDINKDSTGDTGVINFTKIYNSIKGTQSTTRLSNTDSSGNAHDYYQYNLLSSTTPYAPYLRKDKNTNSGYGYISGGTNIIDFYGQSYMADTETANMGLGIFNISSANVVSHKDTYPGTTYDSYFLDGINQFAVTKETSSISDIYYTTSEYKYDLSLTTRPALSTCDFNVDPMGVTLPSCTDDDYWTPIMESAWNYIFKFPLVSSDNLTSNYFYNTNSEFLKKYLSYKLIDKEGNPIEYNTSKFGIYIKDVTNEIISNVTGFDSYLALAPAGLTSFNTFNTTVNDTTLTTAAKTIGFDITSSNIANVTVIASTTDSNDGFLGIYRADDVIGDNKLANAGACPAYATCIPGNHNYKPISYFNYSYTDGSTDTVATIDEVRGKRLYAHTFKLPKGRYYVSSPSTNIDIYYVCAQGQEKGNAGEGNIVYIGNDKISNFDFLLYDPKTFTITDTMDSEKRAYLLANLKWNNLNPSIIDFAADTNHEMNIDIDSYLSRAVIENTNSKYFTFETTRMKVKFYTYTAA